MNTLRDIVQKAQSGSLSKEGFLYLPDNEDWDMDSTCLVINAPELPEKEKNKFGTPLLAQELGLGITFAAWFFPELIENTKNLEIPLSESTLLEAIKYYYDEDNFMPNKA